MKRNTLFGGLALLAAGGVIGAGAMISSNAMADTPDTAQADQVTMINIGPDGEAVQCSFSGTDLDGLLPPLPAGVPAGAVGAGVVISGQAVPADGALVPPAGGQGIIVSATGEPPAFDADNPPMTVKGSSATITVGGATAQTGGGQILTAAPIGDLPVLASTDDARDGTPEECAAMHDQAVEMASSMPTGGVRTETGTATEP